MSCRLLPLLSGRSGWIVCSACLLDAEKLISPRILPDMHQRAYTKTLPQIVTLVCAQRVYVRADGEGKGLCS